MFLLCWTAIGLGGCGYQLYGTPGGYLLPNMYIHHSLVDPTAV